MIARIRKWLRRRRMERLIREIRSEVLRASMTSGGPYEAHLRLADRDGDPHIPPETLP